MAIYRYSGELYHYGKSKKDGAPGVGTGNWRRHPGNFITSRYRKAKETLKYYYDEARVGKEKAEENRQKYRDNLTKKFDDKKNEQKEKWKESPSVFKQHINEYTPEEINKYSKDLQARTKFNEDKAKYEASAKEAAVAKMAKITSYLNAAADAVGVGARIYSDFSKIMETANANDQKAKFQASETQKKAMEYKIKNLENQITIAEKTERLKDINKRKSDDDLGSKIKELDKKIEFAEKTKKLEDLNSKEDPKQYSKELAKLFIDAMVQNKDKISKLPLEQQVKSLSAMQNIEGAFRGQKIQQGNDNNKNNNPKK